MNRLRFGLAGSALACGAHSRKPPRFEQGLNVRAQRGTHARPCFLSGMSECKAFVQEGVSGFLCAMGKACRLSQIQETLFWASKCARHVG
jgi:hypothetical protein